MFLKPKRLSFSLSVNVISGRPQSHILAQVQTRQDICPFSPRCPDAVRLPIYLSTCHLFLSLSRCVYLSTCRPINHLPTYLPLTYIYLPTYLYLLVTCPSTHLSPTSLSIYLPTTYHRSVHLSLIDLSLYHLFMFLSAKFSLLTREVGAYLYRSKSSHILRTQSGMNDITKILQTLYQKPVISELNRQKERKRNSAQPPKIKCQTLIDG